MRVMYAGIYSADGRFFGRQIEAFKTSYAFAIGYFCGVSKLMIIAKIVSHDDAAGYRYSCVATAVFGEGWCFYERQPVGVNQSIDVSDRTDGFIKIFSVPNAFEGIGDGHGEYCQNFCL